MTFKDNHPELQHLVRELTLLRGHNLRFGRVQETLLMFAEGALVCLVLERFLRAVLSDATERETMSNLLERAVSRNLITVPFDDQQGGIRKIVSVRNMILHANYEQAATAEKCSSVAEFFRKSYAGLIDTLYKITNNIVDQIDIRTGQPK